MKVKITYAPEHKSAAAATLAALPGMFPAARVHESTNKAGVCAVSLTVTDRQLNSPGKGGIIEP